MTTSSSTSTTVDSPGGKSSSAEPEKSPTARPTASGNIEQNLPWESDTICRMFSMSKPITSVAAMILYEEGKLQLKDPVAKYIPSFGESEVYRNGSFVSPVTEGLTEPMRIWHLLTHTSGLTYGFHNNHVTDALHRRAGFEWGVPTGDGPRRLLRRVGQPPARLPAGDRVAVRRIDRRARPRRRSGVGPVARRVLSRADPRPARYDRHRFLGGRRQAGPLRRAVLPQADRQCPRRGARLPMPR